MVFSITIDLLLNRTHNENVYPFYRFLTFTVHENEHSSFLTQHFSSSYGQAILRTGKNKASVLIGYTKADNRRGNLLALLENRHLGISTCVNSQFKLNELYRQSDVAFYTSVIKNSTQPIGYSKISSTKELDFINKKIEESLRANDKALCGAYLTELSELCSDLMIDSLAAIYNALAALFSKMQYEDVETFESYTYQQLSGEFHLIQDVFEYFKSVLTRNETEQSFSVSNILSYIDENFNKDMFMTDVAAKFHFSPSYFSTLFKKSTGQTFTKYATAKRIEFAKRLLMTTQISIQDVVDRSGYGDYFQFNKLFKREVGMSPGKYRSEMLDG